MIPCRWTLVPRRDSIREPCDLQSTDVFTLHDDCNKGDDNEEAVDDGDDHNKEDYDNNDGDDDEDDDLHAWGRD